MCFLYDIHYCMSCVWEATEWSAEEYSTHALRVLFLDDVTRDLKMKSSRWGHRVPEWVQHVSRHPGASWCGSANY